MIVKFVFCYWTKFPLPCLRMSKSLTATEKVCFDFHHIMCLDNEKNAHRLLLVLSTEFIYWILHRIIIDSWDYSQLTLNIFESIFIEYYWLYKMFRTASRKPNRARGISYLPAILHSELRKLKFLENLVRQFYYLKNGIFSVLSCDFSPSIQIEFFGFFEHRREWYKWSRRRVNAYAKMCCQIQPPPPWIFLLI